MKKITNRLMFKHVMFTRLFTYDFCKNLIAYKSLYKYIYFYTHIGYLTEEEHDNSLHILNEKYKQ